MKHQISRPKSPFYKSVAFMFALYWAVLVVWQNVGRSASRGTSDMIVKLMLLGYFSLYFLRRAKEMNKKILVIFLLGISLAITFIGQEPMSLSTIIAYIYPLLFMVMVYGVGDWHMIGKKHLLAFCKCVILITLYAAVYAVIFQWDQFLTALSLSNSYGNELKSFFISNHEYGLYLVAAIVSCLMCIQMTPKMNLIWKIFYSAAILLFGVNLILTFSRTSLLALVIFLILFGVFGKGSVRKWIIIAGIAVISFIVLSSQAQNFIYEIILKENNLAGRDYLYTGAVNMYKNGNLVQKLFGHGITNARQYFESTFDHGSVHNAYLQIILYYGLVGLMALIGFLASQLIICIRFIRKDRFMGAIHLGLVVSAATMLFTNTMIIFTSPIDSYFMTIFMFIIPKYVRNAINNGTFNPAPVVIQKKETEENVVEDSESSNEQKQPAVKPATSN